MYNRQPSVVSPEARRWIIGFIGVVFLAMFAAWEVVNFWTTEVGMAMMMGLNPASIDWTGVGWWVRLIAVGMVGLDVFHLIIFFMDRLVPDLIPEDANTISWAAWAIVTTMDMVLSVYTFGFQFEQGVAAGTTRGPAVFQDFLQYAPFIVSLMTWGMTFFMVSIGRSFLAAAFGLPPRKPTPPRPQPQHHGSENHKQPQVSTPVPQVHKSQQFRPVNQPQRQASPPQPQRGGSGEKVDPDVQAILDEFKDSFHTLQ